MHRHEKVPPRSVTIFLSNQCQLKCTCCYAESGDYNKQEINLEIAERSIDKLFEWAEQRGESSVSLHFHAFGEPTLSWGTMKSLNKYARNISLSTGIKLTTTLVSNGIWSSSQREWIVRNIDVMTISIDGIKEVHDAQEESFVVEASLSFDIVFESLKYLQSNGSKFDVRATITQSSVQYLTKSVKFVCKKFTPRRSSLAQVSRYGRGVDEEVLDFNDLITETSSEIQDLG